ncbi:MAG: hypothetical protein CMK59_05775 [Proteobacteria bacterium]|nr:hypothetical protein [Pseudomonadota bacterium]
MSHPYVDSSIRASLIGFPKATMELLQSRTLQKRIDTKFVLRQDRLSALLHFLKTKYAIVLTEKQPIAAYKNLYFDTDNHLFLKTHHRDKRPRYKVRIRHHCDRRMSFVEIKKKSASDRTIKKRQEVPFLKENLQGLLLFIKEHCPVISSEALRPSLRTDFNRITLVGLDVCERITIDTGLQCSNDDNNTSWEWLNGVIVEIKQEHFKPRAPAMLALRNVKATALSISKYCTAASHLLPDVNMKLYRPKMRALRRLIHDRAL